MTATLPPLPAKAMDPSRPVYFTADQMRAYGEACAAAEREARARVVDESADLGSVNISMMKKRIARAIRARSDK